MGLLAGYCPGGRRRYPARPIVWEGPMYKFEIYKDKAGEFRFRFKAPNGETMCSSEGYKAKKSALDAIESIKKNAPAANIDDQAKS